MKKLEYNGVIFVFDSPKHTVVGVETASGAYSGSFEYQAKKYGYIETTGSLNYTVGSIPDKYAGKQPARYILSNSPADYNFGRMRLPCITMQGSIYFRGILG